MIEGLDKGRFAIALSSWLISLGASIAPVNADLLGTVGEAVETVEEVVGGVGETVGSVVGESTETVESTLGSEDPSGEPQSASPTGSGSRGSGDSIASSGVSVCPVDGNSSAYNGYQVVDRRGHPLGWVEDATVDAHLNINQVRFIANGNVTGEPVCIEFVSVNISVANGSVQLPISQAEVARAYAGQ